MSQGGCERRSEVIVKIQKKQGGRGEGGSSWGQGGCERKIEVFVKIKKKSVGGGSGSGGGEVRVDVNEEVKFFCENAKKKSGGSGGSNGSGQGGGGGQGGSEQRIEVYVKIKKKNRGGRVVGVRLGVQGGRERRSEVFVKIQKKIGGWIGSGGGGGG